MEDIKEFPTVQELSNGFSEFKLETAKDILGKKLDFYLESGEKITYNFLDEECLKVRYGNSEVYGCIYSVVSPREKMYIVDFIESFGDAKSKTVVIDLNREIGTIMTAILPSKEEADISQIIRGEKKLPMTSVTAHFDHISIGKPFSENTEKHEFTKELLGKRIEFRYSTNDVYEHYYLNESFYTWHCVEGLEKGLCDTDRCYYLKLADNLYWFTWLEKVVPTIGTVIEDLDEMRSYGKICGYESYDCTRLTNFQVGSYATIK